MEEFIIGIVIERVSHVDLIVSIQANNIDEAREMALERLEKLPSKQLSDTANKIHDWQNSNRITICEPSEDDYSKDYKVDLKL